MLAFLYNVSSAFSCIFRTGIVVHSKLIVYYIFCVNKHKTDLNEIKAVVLL